MSQESSATAPSRRKGALGAHSLDHFGLEVPDLEVAKGFYSAFGLTVREEKGTLGLYTAGSDHCWGRLFEGRRKRLRYLSFGVFDDDLPKFRARIKVLGVALIEPPAGTESNGLWMRHPDGYGIEIRVAEKCSPNAKAPFTMASVPGGKAAAPTRAKAPSVYPRRLSHVAVFTADVPRAVRFLSDVVGLKLSDQSPGIIAFMHAVHGSDHHVVAFASADGPGLHHPSWAVNSIEEIGQGAMNMADKGFARGWGLGRHVLGSNYFYYVRDPWGSYCEYSADIDYIPADVEWQAGDYAPEDSFYLWGPNPPEDFVKNYETVA